MNKTYSLLLYFFLFFIAGVFCYLAERIVNKNKGKLGSWEKFKFVSYFIIAFLVIEVPSAIRFNVGTDFMGTYYRPLVTMKQTGVVPNIELASRFIFYLILNFNLPNQTYFLLTSFIINFFFFCLIFINKERKYTFCLFIYFINCIYFASLSNIRQFMGIAAGTLGITILFNKKSLPRYFLSLVLCLYASICHNSCLIFIPIYILFFIPFHKNFWLTSTMSAIVLSPIFALLFKAILSKTKYSYFFIYFNNYGTGIGNFIMVAPEILIFVLAILALHKRDDSKLYIPLVTSSISLMFFLGNIIIKNNELYLRLYHLLYGFDIAFLPFLIETRSSKFHLVRLLEQKFKVNNGLDYLHNTSYSYELVNCSSRGFVIALSLALFCLSFFFQMILHSFHGVEHFQTIWG